MGEGHADSAFLQHYPSTATRGTSAPQQGKVLCHKRGHNDNISYRSPFCFLLIEEIGLGLTQFFFLL